MNDDNVREFPPSLLTAATRIAEMLKPPSAADPELTLWDEVVRVRLSLMAYGGPGSVPEPPSVDAAIDAANKVVSARRKFAASR
jgi:hypothetical protein